jgi:peptidoglycan hydrolase CwlO-like protein
MVAIAAASLALLSFAGVTTIAAIAPSTASAHAGQLQKNRDKARALAADIAALDAKIDAAVQRSAQATKSLAAVRDQLRVNRRMQRLSRRELAVARSALAIRAVALYKHDDVTALDAVFTANDFGELVSQLTMVQRIARGDRDVVRTIARSKATLGDAAIKLAADERTAKRLVRQRTAQLETIRAQLSQRRALLNGVRSQIRRMASDQAKAKPSPGATVEPPSGPGGGDGPWWSLIQSAAAGNGVSARGMYRLMMIESGGSATIVGPGGYYGLFQYAPSTWKGSWNPWRSASITDGAAQIKATALAIHDGYGHAWWDPSYTWAFEGR